ncbi:hypothetical protein ACFQ14_14710 [Pseudahrensia aquimaris]|uniref:Uncharacterized protein n=1 Tax=Pseudahrensia aquimaris TaxID=744461 RepID=A0ABW3FNE0_9HYPH
MTDTTPLDKGLITMAQGFGGGEQCDRTFKPLGTLLRQVTEHLLAEKHLVGLSRFELWLYFGGSIITHNGSSGPGRLATGRNPPRIIIDLVISLDDYADLPMEVIRQNMADGVEQCFGLMLARALKRDGVRDRDCLLNEFAEAIRDFRTSPIPEYIPFE